MKWKIVYTDVFERWFESLSIAEQGSIDKYMHLLEQAGTELRHPYSSKVFGSRYSMLRELRIQHKGKPYRIFYVFDEFRQALLLCGGIKRNNDRWYRTMIKQVEKILGEYYGTQT